MTGSGGVELTLKDPESGAEFYLAIEGPKSDIDHWVAAGGLRIGENVTFEEVKRLARTMGMKFRAYGAPISGAKSGIRLPRSCDAQKRMEILSRFGLVIREYLGSPYLLGEDMGSNEEDVRRVYAAAGLHQVVVAKRLLIRGGMKSFILKIPDSVLARFFPAHSDSSNQLTAEGIFQSIELLYSLSGQVLAGKKVALQGVGKLGKRLIRMLDRSGARICKVSDRDCAFENWRDGIPVSELLSCIDARGMIDTQRVRKSGIANIIPRDEWCLGELDLLIPGAVPDAIHSGNREDLRCRCIVEAGNIVMDEESSECLFRRGILVAPDFLVNSAIACQFSLFITNRMKPYSESTTRKGALKEMERQFCRYFELAKVSDVSMRHAFDSDPVVFR